MPTAMNPVTISAGIVAAMARVKQANGYENTVKRIFEIDLVEDQIPDGALPAIFVLEDQEGETWEPGDASMYKARLPYIIGGMINELGSDVTDPARVRRIRSFEKDVRKALLQDPTFGGACKESVLRKAQRVVDTDRGFASFIIDMTVFYWFKKETL